MVNKKQTIQENTKLLSTTQVAKLLGISRIAVFKKIKSGKLKAEKIGRNYFIDRNDLGGIFQTFLSEKAKKEIERAVQKTVKEYGQALKQLGNE